MRGSADERERILADISKTWVVGDKPFVRILKYKMDRGKTVADVSMLDVEQRSSRTQPREIRQVSPSSRDVRPRDKGDDYRTNGREPAGAEGEDHRRKRSQITRSLGSRGVIRLLQMAVHDELTDTGIVQLSCVAG